MPFDVDAALRYLVEREGSDLHVKVPSPPMTRIHGDLIPVEGAQALTGEDTAAAFEHLTRDRDQKLATDFAEVGEADFSYQLEGVSRFRVNAFRQRGDVSIVCRAIPYQVRTVA